MSVSMRIATGLGLGFLVVAAGGGVQGRAQAAEVRSVSERLIPFEAGGSIRIQDKNGRLTVEGWPRNEVRIEITRNVRAEDKAKAERLMKELRADVEVRNGRIDIVSHFPKRRETIGIWDILGRKVASLQISYYVQVPAETDLMLGTTNGEVRVHGVKGRVEATTTNGDIRVGDVRGGVTLATTNGEIELTGMTGEAAARTTNGSVVAEVRGVSPTGGIDLMTTNGNVEAYFPNDLKAAVEAVTTNGRVAITFPITSRGVMTSKSIRGTINGGGATISLATTNGNVEVRRLGERRP
ncbi:MAG: DUF4097 domain-containing protein [Candidatus Eisenbacteria bacterium]|uniref:DUF4097 domain-containing protein n=1 Tax=Eiseniibacteriota bacterium TaxID=2212470 RepID=A0A538T0K0_UNCEI|nr:MAG: DUF4097 domain-containing protein [Candidatus Eisenbacteria bacterium]